MNASRSAFGVPMTPTMRQQDRANGHVVRPRARQTYTEVTSTFGPRTAYEMGVRAAKNAGGGQGVFLGVPAGGWNLGRLDAPPTKAPDPSPLVSPAQADSDPMVLLSRTAPALAASLAQLLTDDPRTDARVYEAKVKNLRQAARTVPRFLRPFFEARLRVVEARLQAAQEHKALAIESERSTRTWRLVGWAGAGTGIAVGVGVLVLVLAGARALSAPRRAA